MRKFFLLFLMSMFGLTASLQAQETTYVIIGDGTNQDSPFIPVETYYSYSISQQIYTSAEMQGKIGTVTSVSFLLKTSLYQDITRNFDIYLKNVDKDSFALIPDTFDSEDWVALTSSDLVYSGDVTYPRMTGWVDFELQTPFEYTGGNLLVCVNDKTGDYVNDVYWGIVQDDTDNYTSLHIYNDDQSYTPDGNIGEGTPKRMKNSIKFAITEGTVDPEEPIDPENPGEPVALEPVKYVDATELNSESVSVVWGMTKYAPAPDGFESGHFDASEWINNGDFPWIITSDAYEGNYAMMSSNAGVHNSESSIEIQVETSVDGIMSFYHKASCEQSWDYGYFYLDGEQKTVLTGNSGWKYAEIEVPAGIHTYKWSYVKDFMGEAYDDAYYVDNVTFLATPEAFDGGWICYDDGTLYNAVGLGQAAPFYWGITFPLTSEYDGYTLTKVAIYDTQIDYSYAAGTYTANIYVGGTDAPETLMATQSVELTGTGTMLEIALDNPVAVDPSKPLWITFYTDEVPFPAAGCQYVTPNADWISGDGTEWEHATSSNMYYTWLIRGYLENAKGETKVLGQNDEKPVFAGGSSDLQLALSKAEDQYVEVGMPMNETKTEINFNLYRKNLYGTEVDLLMENTADTSYVDNAWATMEAGAYQWGVSVTEGSEESEVVWSETIGKDMFTTVSVSATVDNGDPVKGTSVTFTNLVEEGFDYTVKLDEEGTYTWDSFRKGTYEMTVSKRGYTSNIEMQTVEIWNASEYNAVLTETIEAVTDLYVSPTGWAMWTGKVGDGDEFFYDFEDGTLDGWVNIDADGDGNVWTTNIIDVITHPGYNSSEGFALSKSYSNDIGPLYPDNYMVTVEKCKIGVSSQLTFYVCAQDENHPNEHYGVAVSTSGNTSADDFTTIWEETFEVGKGSTATRGTTDQTAWQQKTIDLSEYAGQEIYIALRHFNCSDVFILNVDDVALVNAGKSEKALLGYQVYLNDVLVAEDVQDTFYQFENLVDGQEYTTKVIASYTLGDSEEVTYTWTKTPESNFAAATDFTAESINKKAVLNWTLPEVEEGVSAEILGVMIYHNGELLSSKPVAGTTFTDKNGVEGDEYCIRVVYGGENDYTYYAMSEETCTEVFYEQFCDAPTDLFGEYTWNADGTYGATLIYPYDPAAIGDWLHYDDGNFLDGIGGPSSFYWGIMFPASSLSSYDGASLTRVSLYANGPTTGDINIYYGGDTAPGTLVHTQPYTASPISDFVVFTLTEYIPIDVTQNLWIVFSTSQGGGHPAGVTNDSGNPNGRWVSMDGIEWGDIMSMAGIPCTWMIRGLVSFNAKDAAEVTELQPINDYEYISTEGEFVKSGNPTVNATKESVITHYNIYRGTSADNCEFIAETTENTYFDEVEEGTYYYQVTAVYEEYGVECESEFATAYEDETLDYVVVDVTAIEENGVKGMMVYPNPTKGALNITAEDMQRITVTNALGQVVYDREVLTDSEVIEMSGYESGIYMVRIMTENGVAVERITVVK